jgi:signal transduction histidine kinase
MKFVLSVEGAVRDLHPIVRDEIYRIGSEAIRNAYLHSGANELDVNLCYSHNLTIRIRDDGKGIDPDVVTSGKPGHFGLRGMHERAVRIHATLRVSSRPGTGSEVELTIPGKVVFRGAPVGLTAYYDKLRLRCSPRNGSTSKLRNGSVQ